jgi:hypothetical protein
MALGRLVWLDKLILVVMKSVTFLFLLSLKFYTLSLVHVLNYMLIYTYCQPLWSLLVNFVLGYTGYNTIWCCAIQASTVLRICT